MDSPDFYYTLTTKPDGSEKETLVYGNSVDSTVTAVDSCESSFSGYLDVSQHSFPDLCGEPCVLYDDMAELEWLSNFVEESSFTSEEDTHKLNLISGVKTEVISEEARKDDSDSDTDTDTHQHPIFCSEITVPGKTRSKRERNSPCKWGSLRLLADTPSPATSEASETGSLPLKSGKNSLKIRLKCLPLKRKCLHCGIEKTPQWRNGPLGPKTLCNACGVRFRSGRLVPEYRPADSPTFVPSKHSNSHRKVLEMRRQREMQKKSQDKQVHYASMFDVPGSADDDDDDDDTGSDSSQLIYF